MGAPGVVQGDRIQGQCPGHLIPNPVTGAPQPSPPLPFSAPLTLELANTVLIGGKPAALAGSSGLNTPAHVGLHATDLFLVPAAQLGRVTSGSKTVLFEGKPAATAQSTCTCCTTPGQVVATVTDVLIG